MLTDDLKTLNKLNKVNVPQVLKYMDFSFFLQQFVPRLGNRT